MRPTWPGNALDRTVESAVDIGERRTFRDRLTLAAIDLFPIRAAGGTSPNMVLGTMPTRPALLVRLTDTHGTFGWGEVWANFPPRANMHKANLLEDVVVPHLEGTRFTDPVEVEAFLRAKLSTYFLHIGQLTVFEHILAGLDIALWDLALRNAGRSFAVHMGLSNTAAPCYASSINAPDLDRLLPYHATLGQARFKLKIGFDDTADLEFAARAAALCPRGSRLMFDSNQSWDTRHASAMLSELERFDPAFAEEPIRADAAPDEWESLAKATTIPLAGGENVYGIADFLTLAGAGLQVLQPDVAKWGGVSGALALADVLPEGTRLWPHFMGTAVGQMAALCVTAAVGHGANCEMDVNANRLRTDLCGDTLVINDGCVALPECPGLVVPPKPGLLTTFGENAH